jgi:hypothetical protein
VTDTAGPADALQLLGVLLRRWPVVVVGLAVTALVAASLVSQVPVEHEATGKVVIEAPVEDDTPSEIARNPFAAFNPALSVVGDLIAQVVTDDATRQQVAELGGTADFTIGAGGVWAAPVLSISAVSRSPAQASRTVLIVVWMISVTLSDQQAAAGADPDTFATARTLIDPDRTVILYGGRLRTGMATVVIGMAGTLALATFLEQRSRSRRAIGPPQAGVVPPMRADPGLQHAGARSWR